ncbi:hypothetical protein E4T42_00684 [Aureobasidium subglaciale]|nr:hypothetical protein E4T42_00684 [Aureobasidium subglaciale]
MSATSPRRMSFPSPSLPHIPIHSLFPREAPVSSLYALRVVYPEIITPSLSNEASASSLGEWTQEIINEVLSDAGLEHLIDNAVTAESDTPYTFSLYSRFDDLRAASSSKIMFGSILQTVSFRFVDHHDQSQPLTARSMSTIDFNLSAIHSEVYTLAEAFGNVHIFSYVEPDGYSVSSTFQSSLPKSQLAFLRRMRLPTLVNPHRLCQAVRASWLYQSSPQSSHLSICYHHNFAKLLARVQTIKPLLIQAKEHERAV